MAKTLFSQSHTGLFSHYCDQDFVLTISHGTVLPILWPRLCSHNLTRDCFPTIVTKTLFSQSHTGLFYQYCGQDFVLTISQWTVFPLLWPRLCSHNLTLDCFPTIVAKTLFSQSHTRLFSHYCDQNAITCHNQLYITPLLKPASL